MERLIVACVQQRIRVPHTLEEYREDLRRFLRIAEGKHAQLVVFPELAGLSITMPLLGGFRASLFKRAEAGKRRSASVGQRFTGALAQQMARWLQADLRSSLAALLDVEGKRLWQTYSETFSALAKEFHMTIVAPSAYLPDPRDGIIRNISGVFTANGELRGHQAKVMPQSEDIDIALPGVHWDIIPTEAGLLGVMLGNDVLYPEAGRVLAYQGAEVLVSQAACQHPAAYNKLRAGILARMQDNQLFGVASFSIGSNEFGREQGDPLMGKSAIFAPQELTPRYNGVLVEMGNQRSEGVLTAEWNFATLKELWDTSEAPVHRPLPAPQVTQILANLYTQLQSQPQPLQLEDKVEAEARLDFDEKLDELDAETLSPSLISVIPSATTPTAPSIPAIGTSTTSASVPVAPVIAPKAVPIITLDDLPILGSVTSAWPLSTASNSAYNLSPSTNNMRKTQHPQSRVEDETDEMDILDDL